MRSASSRSPPPNLFVNRRSAWSRLQARDVWQRRLRDELVAKASGERFDSTGDERHLRPHLLDGVRSARWARGLPWRVPLPVLLGESAVVRSPPLQSRTASA
ncbi:MAG: hypothetical protein BGO98_33030 [Myxococcales bacterium 68-20]|nr:MAG: hypothetical protein BGO98_33030 [Myxococcales bacterium 68-20]